jgi:hypothetical protein|tara:strand:+ start:922 stop:1119 length:198 start_codon:yes stop_codon:yes gene_type:complete
MDLEHDYRPFLIFGIICTVCAAAVTLGGIGFVGVWMDALYPIIVLFAVASLSISWIRWKNIDEES